ncbi:NTP transferase domain-containing protein [candidate division KSB1 bacterium]
MKKVIIITGETNSGKTYTVSKIVHLCLEQGFTTGGIVTVDASKIGEKSVLNAKDLRKGTEKTLATKEDIKTDIKTRLFNFYPETLSWCNDVLSGSLESDIIFIDEAGKLELENKGFAESLKHILRNYRGILVLSVKERVLTEFLSFNNIADPLILETGKDENIHEIVLRVINRFLTTVCILAGGKGERAGSDKALLRIKGKRLIDYVYETVKNMGLDITTASGSRDIDGFTCIKDKFGSGPIAGLHAALKISRRILILPCDMPFLTPELLLFILDQSTGYDITLCRTGGKNQVQAGVYSDKCLPILENNIAGKKYALQALLGSGGLKIRIIDEKEILKYGAPEKLFLNINTLEKLKKAEILLDN